MTESPETRAVDGPNAPTNPIALLPHSGPSDSIFHFLGPMDPTTRAGSTRPVNPGMYWLDTKGVRLRLRRRSEDNRDWVDVAGAFPVDTNSVDMDFDLVSGNLSANVRPSGVDHAQLSSLGLDSHPQYLLRSQFAHAHSHAALTGLANDDHPQYLPKSIVNAKGDLIGATANDVPAIVPVGGNGTVLTADAQASAGLKWGSIPIDVSFGPFYLSDLPANGVFETYLSYATSPKLVEPGPPGTGDYVMPSAGYVVALFVTSDLARTAGTAEVRVRKNGTVLPFASGACSLNAAKPLRASAIDLAGFPVAANDAVGISIVTTGWAPTSGDIRARLVVRMIV